MNKMILGIMIGVAATVEVVSRFSTKKKIDELSKRIDDLECDMLHEEEIPFIVRDMFEDDDCHCCKTDKEHEETKKDETPSFFVTADDHVTPLATPL